MSNRALVLLGFVLLGGLHFGEAVLERDGPLIQVEQTVVQPPPASLEPTCQELKELLPDVGEVVEISLIRDKRVLRIVWTSVTAKLLSVEGYMLGGRDCAAIFLDIPSGANAHSDHILVLRTSDAEEWSILSGGGGVGANMARVRRSVPSAREADSHQ